MIDDFPNRPNSTWAPSKRGNATISLSASSLGSETVDLIFLCRECFERQERDITNLTLFLSDTRPQYVGSPLAMLPMQGAELQHFTLDLNEARFSNYTSMLHAAGFD